MTINMPDRDEQARLVRYAVGGFSTTLLNIFLFWVLSFIMPGYRSANLIAIILTKIYGYLINKLFVFRSRHLTNRKLVREILTYIASRGFTGVVDYFGLIFLVSVIRLAPYPAKVIVQGIVIILNYVLGKIIVFKP